MEAIQNTESGVMSAPCPTLRRPNAPSYSTPLSVAAAATTPGSLPDATPWRSAWSISDRSIARTVVVLLARAAAVTAVAAAAPSACRLVIWTMCFLPAGHQRTRHAAAGSPHAPFLRTGNDSPWSGRRLAPAVLPRVLPRRFDQHKDGWVTPVRVGGASARREC